MIVRHKDGLVGFEIDDDSPLAREITALQQRRAERGDADPLNRLREITARNVAAGGAIYETTKAVLVREAQEQVAQYPQYADHFAPERDWRLAVCERTVDLKGGLSFERGKMYLARIENDPTDEFYGKTFGWSRLRGLTVLVGDGDLRFVEEASV